MRVVESLQSINVVDVEYVEPFTAGETDIRVGPSLEPIADDREVAAGAMDPAGDPRVFADTRAAWSVAVTLDRARVSPDAVLTRSVLGTGHDSALALEVTCLEAGC